jgi:SAM-dependent methyltransferase
MKGTFLDRLRAAYRRQGVGGLTGHLSPARVREELAGLWFWHIGWRWATLGQLAKTARTDKGGPRHTFQGLRYVDIYERYFQPLRRKHVRVLEIGVLDGKSLRLWKRYFPQAEIFGLDLDPACRRHEEDRIRIEVGSQADALVLDRLCQRAGGPFDIIIDDGSHVNRHIIASFAGLWDHVRPGGFYVIEDLEASYGDRPVHPRPKSNDPTEDLVNSRVDMDRFFERLLFDLDHQKGDVLAIHFWAHLCILMKAGGHGTSAQAR